MAIAVKGFKRNKKIFSLINCARRPTIKISLKNIESDIKNTIVDLS